MKKITAALLIAGLFGSVASAQAGMISFSNSISLTQTNWGPTAISFNKFDTSLGMLTSVVFDLMGTVEGIGKAESLDAMPASVSLGFGSIITLSRPDATTLVVAHPLFSNNFSFSEFDGNINFGGTSGGTTGLQSATKSESLTSLSAGDFALFSGPGTILLNLKAIGTSSSEGSGNLITQFSTYASGLGKVTYNYNDKVTYNYNDNVVPEPATFAIMGLGLGFLALTRRRRTTKAA